MPKHKVTLIRTEGANNLKVLLDDKLVSLQPSLKVRSHSPTGFNAGYGGSGPAQTALALMLKVMLPHLATRCYQTFKWNYLADHKYLEVGTHVFTFDLEQVKKEGGL